MHNGTPTISYIALGHEALDRIEPLWNELRNHHATLSEVWQSEICSQRFETRRDGLLAKTRGGKLLVLLVLAGDDVPIGYCVSSILPAGAGEIDSIYVTECCRRRGIGRELIARSLDWLRQRNAMPIIVDVFAANDQAESLYQSFGFVRRTMSLRLPETASRTAGC